MKYEMTPAQRIDAASKRLINLRLGSGDYSPEQRELEIDRAQTVIQRAFKDSGDARASATIHDFGRPIL